MSVIIHHGTPLTPRAALEIEAAKNHLVDCGCDLRGNAKEIEDLKAEIAYLEREFSLTGVTSEYEL